MKLNLPPVKLRVADIEGSLKVFDPLREKYVALTPEENVRQHFTRWLVEGLNYPAPRITNETQIHLNGLTRRCDTVVWRKDLSPLMIVEYKAPEVKVTQAVFDQIARYNMVLHAEWLVVSNGLNHYCCKMDYAHHCYHFLPRVPDYNDLPEEQK